VSCGSREGLLCRRLASRWGTQNRTEAATKIQKGTDGKNQAGTKNPADSKTKVSKTSKNQARRFQATRDGPTGSENQIEERGETKSRQNKRPNEHKEQKSEFYFTAIERGLH
jgi:hypothetical protein